MLTRFKQTKVPIGLLTAVLLLQFSLLPSALNIIEYYSLSHSSKASCNVNRCTCNSEGVEFCPMHNKGGDRQATDQSYVCNCSHGHHTADFTLVNSASPDAIIVASLTRGVRELSTLYSPISDRIPPEPFRQVFRPPG